MATSNFLTWGPASGSAVAENDAQYAADQNRLTGVPVDAIFTSALANKLFQQLTFMVAAIGQFMVAQGVSASDANLATLTANLTAALQSIGTPGIIAVPFSASPNFAGPAAATPLVNFEMTLTGNVGSSTYSGLVSGQLVTFILHQDATGGRTFAWPTGFAGGAIDPGVSRTSIQQFMRDQTGVWRPIGPMISSSVSGGS